MYDKDDPYNKLPNIEDCSYIVVMWNKAGMISRGGMAVSPLTWCDIDSFSKFNSVSNFEAEMMIELSRSFVEGLDMKGKDDKPPYKVEMTKEDWIARERSIDMQFKEAESSIKKAVQ